MSYKYWVELKEAAEILGVVPNTVKYHIKEGRLRYIRLKWLGKRSWLIYKEDIANMTNGVTIRKAAEMLDRSESFFDYQIKNGRLKTIKVGKIHLIPDIEIERLKLIVNGYTTIEAERKLGMSRFWILKHMDESHFEWWGSKRIISEYGLNHLINRMNGG